MDRVRNTATVCRLLFFSFVANKIRRIDAAPSFPKRRNRRRQQYAEREKQQNIFHKIPVRQPLVSPGFKQLHIHARSRTRFSGKQRNRKHHRKIDCYQKPQQKLGARNRMRMLQPFLFLHAAATVTKPTPTATACGRYRNVSKISCSIVVR